MGEDFKVARIEPLTCKEISFRATVSLHFVSKWPRPFGDKVKRNGGSDGALFEPHTNLKPVPHFFLQVRPQRHDPLRGTHVGAAR